MMTQFNESATKLTIDWRQPTKESTDKYHFAFLINRRTKRRRKVLKDHEYAMNKIESVATLRIEALG